MFHHGSKARAGLGIKNWFEHSSAMSSNEHNNSLFSVKEAPPNVKAVIRATNVRTSLFTSVIVFGSRNYKCTK